MATGNIKRIILRIFGVVAGILLAQNALAQGCVNYKDDADLLQGKANHVLTALGGDIQVPVAIKAIHDQVQLLSPPELGAGLRKQAMATLTFNISRKSVGDELVGKTLTIHWPISVVGSGEEYGTIIGMSYAQNVPVNLVLHSDATDLGMVTLTPKNHQHDGNGRVFGGEIASTIFAEMSKGGYFYFDLRIGDFVASQITVRPEDFALRMDQIYIPMMDDLHERTKSGSC